MEEVNGEELVKKFAEEMEEMLGRKMKSVKVRMVLSLVTWAFVETASLTSVISSQRLAEAAEDADLYHEYNETIEVCASTRAQFFLI